MKKYNKLGKDCFYLAIGSFASKMLFFVMVPFYTNVLSTYEYGISDLITVLSNFLMPIFTLMIGESVMRFALDKSVNKKQILSISLYIVILGIVAILLVLPLVKNIMLTYKILFLGLYISSAVYSVVSQFVKGINCVKSYSISGVLQTIIIVLFNIIFLVILKMGIVGYILSYIIGFSISTVYLIIKERIYTYIVAIHKIEKDTLKNMIKYSLPLIPNSISWWINNSSDKILINYFCNASIQGIYSVSYKIPSILTVVSGIFLSAWRISSVEDFGSKDSKKFFENVANKLFSGLIVISTFIILFIKIIARIMYVNDFYSAWKYSLVLLLGYIFYTLADFYGTIYTAAKKTRMIFYSTLFAAISNIVLNCVLIPKLGAMGAALATLCAYIFVFMIRLIDSRKILILSLENKKIVIEMVLISIQIIITLMDVKYSFFISLIISICLITIERNNFKSVVQYILNKVRWNYKC